jgi:membrane associated rhomboid family serine protease
MSNVRFTRPSRFPPVVKYLIITNAIIFILQSTIGAQWGLTETIMLYPVQDPSFRPYQIITHMFAHGGITHILFNMLALWMFGSILENYWGDKRFLNFYIICGIGAAAFHLLVQYLTGNGTPALGASGAIMGLLAAFGYLFPNTEMIIFPIPFPIKAKWAVLGMAAFDVFGGLGYISDNVAHFAHLGGAITGFILVFFWSRKDRSHFY